MSTESSSLDEAVTVHLIDAARGRILQLWCFADKPVISIGRADDRDVVIVDPYVSRCHAELRYVNDQWWLFALGRHGVIVQGQSITDTLAYDGMQFRLGSDGPVLRFGDSMVSSSNAATLTLESHATIVLRVDEAKVSSEVRQIAEGTYFQELQARARELRRQREASETNEASEAPTFIAPRIPT